jgi:hypothetical protein
MRTYYAAMNKINNNNNNNYNNNHNLSLNNINPNAVYEANIFCLICLDRDCNTILLIDLLHILNHHLRITAKFYEKNQCGS